MKQNSWNIGLLHEYSQAVKYDILLGTIFTNIHAIILLLYSNIYFSNKFWKFWIFWNLIFFWNLECYFENFEILWNFWKFWNFMNILNFLNQSRENRIFNVFFPLKKPDLFFLFLRILTLCFYFYVYWRYVTKFRSGPRVHSTCSKQHGQFLTISRRKEKLLI